MMDPFEDEMEAVTSPLREINMVSNFYIKLQEFSQAFWAPRRHLRLETRL